MDQTPATVETPASYLGDAARANVAGVARWIKVLLPFIGLALVNLVYVAAALIMKRMGQEIEISRFWDPYNLVTVLIQTVVVAIAGLGMTFVIVSGGIDLSVGSVVALVTVVIALALKPLGGGDAFLPVWVAALLGILTGGVCGFLNGAMITGLRIVPFIATLGMFSMARGFAKLLSEEQKIDARMTWLNDLMLKSPKDEWLAVEPSWFRAIPDDVRIPIESVLFSPGLWIMAVAIVSMILMLRFTTFGRYTVAIGSNEATARLCGVRVKRTKILIYTLSGLLVGLGGTLMFSRLSVGDPSVAAGMELDVIAAVVIGGGSLSGGEGSLLGTFVGALTMSLLRNACDFLGWGNYVQEIFIGVFIVIFVAIDQLRRARSTT